MNTYFDEAGNKLGEAWSVMDCLSTDEHPPHENNSEYYCYGPYLCPGVPRQPIYDTPPRKPVEGWF